MPKADGIQYASMRDDHILYWLKYLKEFAAQPIKDSYLVEAADVAFRRGLIGEKWYDYFVGRQKLAPWQTWDD